MQLLILCFSRCLTVATRSSMSLQPLLRLVGYTAHGKTAGSHRKVKGKGRDKENSAYDTTKKRPCEVLDNNDEGPVKRGHPHGSNNYTNADMKTLLDLVEENLTLGQQGWQSIHAKFIQWAKRAGRPHRKVTSLETKFKQVILD